MHLAEYQALIRRASVRVERAYRTLFSIEEIEKSTVLQWMLGGLLLFFYAIFDFWIGLDATSVSAAQNGTASCWPYFQECSRFFFLEPLPNGYSQTIFYMGLYAVMMVIVWAMWSKRWATAHALIFSLWIWELLVVLVFSYMLAAPYNYYHLTLTAVLLFARHKEYFLKLTFVFMYFMSATIKLDSTWILGSYFTALKTGLPIFPDALTPFFTNVVIFMQMIGSWFLLSKRVILQRLAFIYFLAFHLYSGIFVLYLYPTVSLPSLVILFGPMYRYTPIPFARSTAIGWFIILLLAIFQLFGFVASGDRRITLEGNKFGMYMFEANHQCAVTVEWHSRAPNNARDFESADGTQCSGLYCLVARSKTHDGEMYVTQERYESGSAWNRCYPYSWWSRYHAQCERNQNIERIGLTMDHSINGGPFYRIVNVPNICDTAFNALGNNSWVKSPPEAPIVGYPVQNTYHY